MATIKALIRTSKKEGEANVRFRVSDGRGIQLFHLSDISVPIQHWDAKKECIKPRAVMDANLRVSLNRQINDRRDLVAKLYEENRVTSSDELENLIAEILNPKPVMRENLFSLLDKFSTRYEYGKTEWKNYKSLARMLSRYEGYIRATEKPSFELKVDMNKDVVEDFLDYVRNEYILIEENPALFRRLLSDYPLVANIRRKTTRVEQRGGNTMIKIKQRLKCFLNWCIGEKVIDKNPFDGIVIGSAVNGTPYYISIEERDTIANFDFSGKKELEAQRDIFIFQCLVGCRVGDLLNFKNSNIENGFLEYIPHKTKGKRADVLSVPLHDKAKEILHRYHKDGANEPILPFISAQKYNDAIKKIFTACGVTRNVVVLDPKNGEPMCVPINEVASSHLARRTFVGNLYKKVKDPNLIGKLSGHSEGSKAFLRYRDIDDDMKKETINLL